MKLIFSSFLILMSGISSAAPQTIDLWATKFTWSSPDKKTEASIGNEMKKVVTTSRAYDPDCFYGTGKEKTCGATPDKKLTEELDALSAALNTETNKAFSVIREKEGKKYRDFGGLAQGFVLEKLKAQVKGNWFANFAGDILITGPLPSPLPLIIEDYEAEGLPYANVSMSQGWLLGSEAPEAGADIIDPATGKLKEKSDFYKVVLFAKPDFSGARLDGWSTALIVGGKELLKKLWEDKAYQGQWAWLTIDNRGNGACSENINCQLFNKTGSRTVSVNW